MIGNIKLQQAIANQSTRQTKNTRDVARLRKDQQSHDRYMSSELAAMVKSSLESLQEQSDVDKLLRIKMMNQHGVYHADVEQLAEKLVSHYYQSD